MRFLTQRRCRCALKARTKLAPKGNWLRKAAGYGRYLAARACSCLSSGCCSGAGRDGRGRRPPPPSSAHRSAGAPPHQRGPRPCLHRHCWRRRRRRRPPHCRCHRPLCRPLPVQVQRQPSRPQTGGCSLRSCLGRRHLLARPMVAVRLLQGGCRAGPAHPAQRRHPTWTASDGGRPSSLRGTGPGAGGCLAPEDARSWRSSWLDHGRLRRGAPPTEVSALWDENSEHDSATPDIGGTYP